MVAVVEVGFSKNVLNFTLMIRTYGAEEKVISLLGRMEISSGESGFHGA